MSDKINIDEVENAEQLKEAYEKLVEQYKEVIKGAGPIAKKAIEIGYKTQITKINEKYNGIKQAIDNTKKDIGDIEKHGELSEMGVARDASIKKQEARQWQNSHEGRSETVKHAIETVQRGTTSAKSMIAMGAIKLTTFGAKGARLFGAKGTAERIAKSGDKYAHALFTKDSRIASFAERMAESGFVKADAVRNTISHTKEVLEGYKRAGIDAVKGTGQKVKDTVSAAKKIVRDTRDDIGDIEKHGELSEMGVARDASIKKQEARQWQNSHEGRSETVKHAIETVQRGTTSAKSMIAMGAIKLTTFGAKGARLFGAKGTAERIVKSGDKYAHALFTKDSRIASFAERMAESGFVKADTVRNTISHTKEVLEGYGRAGIDAGKKAKENVVQTATHVKNETVRVVKKGTLEVGKAAVIPVAAIGALGAITLDAAKSGVKTAGEKVSEIGEDIKDFRDLATAKTESVKNDIKVGFFSKVSRFLDKVKVNVDKSLVNSKEAQEQSNEKYVAAKEKFTPQQDAQDKDDGR